MRVTNSSVCVSVEWHVCGSRKSVINNSASSISGGRIPRGMVGVKIGADNGIGLRYESMDWRGVGDMGGVSWRNIGIKNINFVRDKLVLWKVD